MSKETDGGRRTDGGRTKNVARHAVARRGRGSAFQCGSRACPAWCPFAFLGVAASLLLATATAAGAQDQQSKPPLRELVVPFQDLNVLLEGQTRRVLLSRAEYEELQRKAAKTPQSKSPYAAELLSADSSSAA